MVARAEKPSIWEVKAEGFEFEANLSYILILCLKAERKIRTVKK